MTNYEALFQHLKEYSTRADEFELRSRKAVYAVLQGFYTYLDAPASTGRVCRIGDRIDDTTTTYLPDQLAELRPDGKFVACLTVSEPATRLFLRFGFYVRIDGESFVLQSGDPNSAREFRVKTLDVASLSDFYGDTVAQAIEFFSTSANTIALGGAKHPVGFGYG
jgi:hypothetical protein